MTITFKEASPLRRITVRDEGIEALFEAHYPGLCRLAYLILGDRRSAEEVVMDAFVRTFSAWGRIRNVERSDAYLRRVVVNLCRTQVRRGGGIEEPLIDSGDPQETGRTESGSDSAMDVWRAVQLLPRRQRITIVLRYYQDLPETEIATLMGCTGGTVKSQLAKARATLARLLKEENTDV